MEKKSILLGQTDHKFLTEHLEKAVMSDYNRSRLKEEVKNASIYADEELPDDVVSLYKEAKIISEDNGQEFTFRIVLPKDADIREKKVSVFAPISIALFGYQTGDIIHWEMPDGIKAFKIISVYPFEK